MVILPKIQGFTFIVNNKQSPLSSYKYDTVRQAVKQTSVNCLWFVLSSSSSFLPLDLHRPWAGHLKTWKLRSSANSIIWLVRSRQDRRTSSASETHREGRSQCCCYSTDLPPTEPLRQPTTIFPRDARRSHQTSLTTQGGRASLRTQGRTSPPPPQSNEEVFSNDQHPKEQRWWTRRVTNCCFSAQHQTNRSRRRTTDRSKWIWPLLPIASHPSSIQRAQCLNQWSGPPPSRRFSPRGFLRVRLHYSRLSDYQRSCKQTTIFVAALAFPLNDMVVNRHLLVWFAVPLLHKELSIACEIIRCWSRTINLLYRDRNDQRRWGQQSHCSLGSHPRERKHNNLHCLSGLQASPDIRHTHKSSTPRLEW